MEEGKKLTGEGRELGGVQGGCGGGRGWGEREKGGEGSGEKRQVSDWLRWHLFTNQGLLLNSVVCWTSDGRCMGKQLEAADGDTWGAGWQSRSRFSRWWLWIAAMCKEQAAVTGSRLEVLHTQTDRQTQMLQSLLSRSGSPSPPLPSQKNCPQPAKLPLRRSPWSPPDQLAGVRWGSFLCAAAEGHQDQVAAARGVC